MKKTINKIPAGKPKRYLPYIIFAAVLIIAAAIVINGINAKNTEKQQKREYVESISTEDMKKRSAGSEMIYEFIQTDPESGLAIIYTFSIFKTEDGKLAGNILIDASDKSYDISCGVMQDGNIDVFLFSDYIGDSEKIKDAVPGAELAKLHGKDGRIVPELILLPNLLPGEDLAPNF